MMIPTGRCDFRVCPCDSGRSQLPLPVGRVFGIVSSIVSLVCQSPPRPAGGAPDGYGLG